MCNAPIFMHSKQGKKATIPHHLHKLQHTSLQTHKNQKKIYNLQIVDV